MNNLLKRGLSIEGAIVLGGVSYLTYNAIKDSRLAKEEVNRRTRGPEAAGLGAGLGMAMGLKLLDKAKHQPMFASGFMRTYGPSRALAGALAIGGTLAAASYAAGEAVHNDLGPEVVIPAAAKVGAAAILLGYGYNKGLDLILDNQSTFIDGIRSTAEREFANRAGKLSAALSHINVTRTGVARILTAFSLVGAAKTIEAKSVRRARERQEDRNQPEEFMTPEQYGTHMGREEIRNQRREPLVNIKLNQEGYIDHHALTESLLK